MTRSIPYPTLAISKFPTPLAQMMVKCPGVAGQERMLKFRIDWHIIQNRMPVRKYYWISHSPAVPFAVHRWSCWWWERSLHVWDLVEFCYALQTGQNPKVWLFKWKLLRSVFLECCLLCTKVALAPLSFSPNRDLKGRERKRPAPTLS